MAADAKLLAQIELVGDIDEWIVDAVCDPDCDAYRGPNGGGCSYCIAKYLVDKLTDAGRLLPPGGEVSTQWAAKVTRRNGVARYVAADDREHAVLIAESIESCIASLNGPTFAEYDVKQAEVVHRTVDAWPDGTELFGPWEVVSGTREGSDG